jgi:hypothetical protein
MIGWICAALYAGAGALFALSTHTIIGNIGATVLGIGVGLSIVQAISENAK